MNRDVFITCALTGAADTAGRSPHVPVTPEQIAESGLAAAEAGAAILHIHVRDPATGLRSRDLELFRKAVALIRARNDAVILNLTGGMGGDIDFDAGDDGAPLRLGPETDFAGPEARIAHILELRPEICSLDCGSMNFGEVVYATKPSWLRRMAGMIRDAGVKPELEVFELGHLRQARLLIDEGLVDAPPMFQLCLGVQWAAEATPATMMAMAAQLPPGAVWAGFGLGPMQFPMAAQAMLLGGHVRVGLEDNLMLSRGVLATNAQLVERAVGLVGSLGGRVLGPEEARARLSLKAR